LNIKTEKNERNNDKDEAQILEAAGVPPNPPI
jgi:hypothetical protein